MSRPFSYNDKNFTVIGNLLILHIPFDGYLEQNSFICDVPPEINKRIPYSGITASYYRSPYSPVPNISLFIQNSRLLITNPGVYNSGQFFGITNLKDI